MVRRVKAEKKREKEEAEQEGYERLEIPPLMPQDKVWVIPFFAKPGRHTYLIKFKNSENPQMKRAFKKAAKLAERIKACDPKDTEAVML